MDKDVSMKSPAEKHWDSGQSWDRAREEGGRWPRAAFKIENLTPSLLGGVSKKNTIAWE